MVGPESAMRAHFKTAVAADAFVIVEADLFLSKRYRSGRTIPLAIPTGFTERRFDHEAAE